ncbi:MAG: hypothetical protein JNM56_36950 [Planctomycetia bacterium]|nr:hypothetical protein [Planctomycetia bacterium]
MREETPLNWDKLPSGLRYLVVPAEKYGSLQFDEKIYEFGESMSEADRQALRKVAMQMLESEAEIDQFLNEYRMTEHPEAQLVYFLGHLIALLTDAGFLK